MERKVAVTNLEHQDQEKNKQSLEQSEAATKTENATDESVDNEETVEETQKDEVVDLPESKESDSKSVTEEAVEKDSATADEQTVTDSEVAEVPASDTASDVEPDSEVSEEQESEEEKEEVEPEVDALAFYTKILDKVRELVKQDDWALVSNEFANFALHISDGPESASEEVKALLTEFNTLRDEFEERKRAHYEELNKRKEANLATKKELLKQFSDLISEEKWTATKEVSQLRGKWESIKLLPHSEIDALNERFEALMKEFESHKVERLVSKLQKEEENFTLKLVILEKMDALNERADSEKADFDELDKEFHDLIVQWRKVGRVPAEKNQQAWDHYNKAQDTFNELRFKHDKKYRESVERALEKKKKLIKEAEALLDSKDLADAARRVNKLHKAWKKTGNLPQKEENELWDKFKAATDAFNDKKSDNIDVLRDQEQKNYDEKLLLIKRAEEIQGTENYDEGHQGMQKLMSEWKKIGPVPRKKSSKIWKQFKEAMDVFYNERREHFKDVRKDQKDNLTKKNELLSKLQELADSDDPAMAVQKAKELQNEFKNIGHVPLKFKNKIWKQYREVCDAIYGNYRSSGSDLGMERELAREGIDPASRKEIIKYQKEAESLRKEVSKLEAEMIQFEEAQTYFKPTNKGNKLRDELQSKIDKAAEEIAGNKATIRELNQKIDELKSESDEE